MSNCFDGDWSIRRVGAFAVAVLVTLIVSATLLVSTADAAYLNRSDCLNSLVGNNGNDNEVGLSISQVNNSSIGPATGWAWTGHTRVNAHLIYEDIVVYGQPYFQRAFRLTCSDANGNGFISSSEDWNY